MKDLNQTIISKVGKELRKLRQKKGLFKSELAREAKVNRISLIRLEGGKWRSLNLRLLIKICEPLGVYPEIRLVKRRKRKK